MHALASPFSFCFVLVGAAGHCCLSLSLSLLSPSLLSPLPLQWIQHATNCYSPLSLVTGRRPNPLPHPHLLTIHDRHAASSVVHTAQGSTSRFLPHRLFTYIPYGIYASQNISGFLFLFSGPPCTKPAHSIRIRVQVDPPQYFTFSIEMANKQDTHTHRQDTHKNINGRRYLKKERKRDSDNKPRLGKELGNQRQHVAGCMGRTECTEHVHG